MHVRVALESLDVVVVGAGAAGLATAVFAARSGASRVLCLDGANRIGAKILVSGGGRCNVTNETVDERDYWGSSPRDIRRVLRAFPSPRAVAFFRELGVPLHPEEDGKLFPDSGSARDVLEALLTAARAGRVEVRTGQRVVAVERGPVGLVVRTQAGAIHHARAVVLATGGQSLPKSGSDGFGYQLARGLGHTCVDTTPALVPLLLDEARCARLAGVSHPAELRLGTEAGGVVLRGALLWTHFGASGPVVLDASRHWLRARRHGTDVRLELSVLPGETFGHVEEWLLARQDARPKARVVTILAERLPQAVADAWLDSVAIASDRIMAQLDREARRRLVHALTGTVLAVRDSRGYGFAEVTAGGVPLAEVDTATMESRVCSGLYLVGEILDVDGRLGGFNFQWAWSSAWVAGRALGGR